MAANDTAFTGSIPQLYEECLVPVLFEPYARDLVDRARDLGGQDILEIAAGTGAVTRLLAGALPDARITATDLNPDMIAAARQQPDRPNVAYSIADAMALPFGEDAFDLALCQFGAMFFPDRIKAYCEARRVLRPHGIFMFNVWDRLDANIGSLAVHHAVRAALPDPKPHFLARTPFGYHDCNVIREELRAAGFGAVTIDRVGLSSPPEVAAGLARGMCLGSPLAGELAQHPREAQDRALAAAIDAVKAVASAGPLAMSALVVTARR